MFGWIGLELWAGARLHVWNASLIPDTIVWVAGTAIVLYFRLNKAVDDPAFLPKTVKGTLEVAVFAEFFLNLFVFRLLTELAIQIVVGSIVMLAAFSEQKPGLQRAQGVLNGLLAVIGFCFLGYTLVQLYRHWQELDGHALFLQFALPVWLTLGILPFIYVLSVYVVYDWAFRGVNWATPGWKARWRTRLALITAFRLKRHELRSLTWYGIRRVAEASGYSASRAVIAEFRQEQRAKAQAKREAEERFIRYAGSNATDDRGRRLDRREFRETTEALTFLGTCQMGWYRNQGGHYRADLLRIVGDDFTRRGLPKEHGITVRVSDDGQAWYAWRRTVTGWCFAIGAAGPPPDHWEYDGPDPPRTFPGKGAEWGGGPFRDEANRNWH
jgi:hypothetical protein